MVKFRAGDFIVICAIRDDKEYIFGNQVEVGVCYLLVSDFDSCFEIEKPSGERLKWYIGFDSKILSLRGADIGEAEQFVIYANQHMINKNVLEAPQLQIVREDYCIYNTEGVAIDVRGTAMGGSDPSEIKCLADNIKDIYLDFQYHAPGFTLSKEDLYYLNNPLITQYENEEFTKMKIN